MAKDSVRFGPAGIPIHAKGGTTIDGVKATAELGLRAMEIEWTRNVPKHVEQFKEAAELSEKLDVRLSVHGPYWINPCAETKKKLEIAHRGLVQGLRAGDAAGAYAFVFHPGYYGKQTPAQAFKKAKETLKEVLAQMKQERLNRINLAPETTGKQKAFGTLEEVVKLAAELDRVIPCVDFGHLYCRNLCKLFHKKEDFKAAFDLVEKNLGPRAARNLHIHFSAIKCNKRGDELEHLKLGSQTFPQFKPLAEAIVENGYTPTIICESPLIDQDALKMKAIYERLAR